MRAPAPRKKYYEPVAGEWLRPIRAGYRLACCDCNLVHDVVFVVEDGKLGMAARRNNRATAQRRRQKNK